MPDAQDLAILLRDLVDVLIPGDATWPAASLTGVQALLALRLMEVRGEEAVDELEQALLACGGPLAALDDAGRVAVIERLEREQPALFKLVRAAVYLGYYESPAVIRVVQTLGQPYQAIPIEKGYPLAPFDVERDRPRHGRGRWLATDEVVRVDLSGIGNEHGSR